MNSPKGVWLVVGKEGYTVETPLSEPVIERIQKLIEEACGSPSKGMDQANLLVLACLQLAYRLDATQERLKLLLSRLEDATASGREIQDLLDSTRDLLDFPRNKNT